MNFTIRYFPKGEKRPTGAKDFVTEADAAAWLKTDKTHTAAILFRLKGNRLLAYWDYKNQVWDYSKVKIVKRGIQTND